MFAMWFSGNASLLCDSDCLMDHLRSIQYGISEGGTLALMQLALVFQHKGVRVEDMQKAWEKNQQKTQSGNKSKTALRGGSTITQQLAKNLFLSSEQHYLRKGQELIITGLLELILSKQRLFEIYLNSVEWGEGIFGIGAASHYYYASTPALLDREQAAALASALPAPKCFDKPQYCRKANIHFPTRQDFILENMDRVALTPYPKSAK
jgi:monofunctional biosynthetic peptidoglycan transglycosylase